MSEGSSGAQPQYWQRYAATAKPWEPPPGEHLSALRRGIGRAAGSVPQMWRFYTTLTDDGRLTTALRAEHVALTLFGVHQQSKRAPMHETHVGLGSAARVLRGSPKVSEDAVDRRFSAAATATSMSELSVHLRGLITQLRGIDQPLDYSMLCRDLRAWQRPDQIPRIRRRWGSEYFVGRESPAEADEHNSSDTVSASSLTDHAPRQP